ncbi:hypothetical protein ACFE04_030582 [Oxalis oulophora]
MRSLCKIQREEDDYELTIAKHDVSHSPSSGEDSMISDAPSPKKRKYIAHKKVVSIPICDVVDGSKRKGDAFPPSDSWTWRKYGQKPIKGSLYPRGYYRCSSFKSCLARKQVERNRMDPTKLVITYAGHHNHPLPTTTTTKHQHVARPVKEQEFSEELVQPREEQELESPMCQAKIELCDGYEFGWYADVESMSSSVLEDQRTICKAGSVSSCSSSCSSTSITMDDDFTMMF